MDLTFLEFLILHLLVVGLLPFIVLTLFHYWSPLLV